MNFGKDVLLINSFAPRQRIVSDAALENGLAIIRTHLEENGFNAEVVDAQRVSGTDEGVPKWCLNILRFLTKLQVLAYSKIKLFALLLFYLTWPFQSLSLFYRKKYMDKYMMEIVLHVKSCNIPVVGIKVWNGDAYTWSIELAKKIRQYCPETTIMAGGPQVKVYGERVLEVDEFDVVIMGPGEEMMVTLMQMRRNSLSKEHFLSKISREISQSRFICAGNYSEDKRYQLKAFTIPKYTHNELEDKILFHTLVDGMGCTWNKCNFCSHSRQNKEYIARSVDEIKNEMLTMSGQGISFFRFSSSETPLKHGKAIAQMILDNKMTVNYSMFVRAGKATPEMYDAYCLMIKSGLRAVFMGAETGHDLINDKVMNKGVTKKDIIETIQCIKLASDAVGLPCKVGLSMIYPTPVVEGVTLQDIFKENVDLIENALPDTVIINPPGVIPETTWFEKADHFGFKMSEDYVEKLMHYEYSMYKPVQFWENLNVSLNGQSVPELLAETSKMHKVVQEMEIPIGISDEFLMMLTAIDQSSKLDLMIFKQHSLLDIMTGSSEYIKKVVEKINNVSRINAAKNANIEKAVIKQFSSYTHAANQ